MDFVEATVLSALFLVVVLAGTTHWAEALDSPLKQQQAGIEPKDITCADRHVLAIRTTQDPICVTPETAEIMLQRGIITTILGQTLAETGDQAPSESDVPVDSGRIDDYHDEEADTTNHTTNNTRMHTDRTEDAKTESQNVRIAITDTGLEEEEKTRDAEDDEKRTADDGKVQTERPTEIRTIPASAMSVVNFYVTDDDLNISRNAAEVVSTDRLQFMINDTPIPGPATMTETGPNTGQFYVRLELPATIDGRPLNQNDVVHITYLDQTDYSGEPRTVTGSFTLASTYAQMQADGGGSRIGHEFTLRIYEPDANLDSRDENKIPLSSLEFRSEGGIKTLLSNSVFDANRSHMVETGPNTGIFEVEIKIPRQIDGKIIHIGDWYEITYMDATTPSGSAEEIVLKGKIGR